MASWLPITEPQMEELLRKELLSCSEVEREAYERIRIPMRSVPILRFGQLESVLAIGEFRGSVLIFEDIECGFEWCQPEHDGVIRSYGFSQAGLQSRLYEVLHCDDPPAPNPDAASESNQQPAR